MALKMKGRGPGLDQLEYDIFWTEYRAIEESRSPTVEEPEEEPPKEPPGECEQEIQWLKEAGFDTIVKKYKDSKEIDANDAAVSNITASLTRKQAEVVRKRIDTLNESTKRKLNIQLPGSSKQSYYPADVRTIFPPKTSALPSNSFTNRIHHPTLNRKSNSEGVQLLKQTSLEDVEQHCHRENSNKVAKPQGICCTLSAPTLSDRTSSDEVRLHAGVQTASLPHGSVFYVTGTTKQELFNAAEKTKETSVDEEIDSMFGSLDIDSQPETSPDAFHEVPVDVPDGKSHSPERRVNGKNKPYTEPRFPRLPNFTLSRDELGVTRIQDLSSEDMRNVRSLALIELTALFDSNGLALHRRKPIKRRVRESGIFGVPLQYMTQQDRLRNKSTTMPLFLIELLNYLEITGAREEGILRIPGGAARIKLIREELEETFSEGTFPWEERRPHDCAALLKQFLRSVKLVAKGTLIPEIYSFNRYNDERKQREEESWEGPLGARSRNLTSMSIFRELPFPLLTQEYLPTFASVESISDRKQQLQALNLLILLLPSIHRDCLKVLLEFLNNVVSCEKQNKMSLNNVAMIMAPNLFLSSEAKTRPTIREMKQAQATVNIVRMLIKYQMILWTIPGFMVMQVRYLYEAEGNKKAKDAKAVRKLLAKRMRTESTAGIPNVKKQSMNEAPVDFIEADLQNNIIRVKAPMLNKVAMAIQLHEAMCARDVVAKFRRRPSDISSHISRQSSLGASRENYKDCVNPHNNNKFAKDDHFLFEMGGNIGERCLENSTNMMALYRVNPHAEWIIKPRPSHMQ